MTRPIYETEKDRIIQREIMNEYRKASQEPIGVKEMPLLHPFDFAFYKKDCIGVITISSITEIKKRLVNHDTYREIILSKFKVDKCIETATSFSIPFLFIVKFNDGIYCVELFDGKIMKELKTSYGGRTDRNDKKDIENCYMIPNILFKKIA